MKNKWLAAVLNLILPGVGYIYIGESRVVFGVMLLISEIASFFIGFFSSSDAATFSWLDLVPAVAFSATFVVDAFLEAGRTNKVAAKNKA
ncbi:MAG TPA: hypothetical protein VNG90_04435 [Candidatus Acidoferrum sp.]|nr:hypothetical protein [Candidatus Acidoferrum sp.]